MPKESFFKLVWLTRYVSCLFLFDCYERSMEHVLKLRLRRNCGNSLTFMPIFCGLLLSFRLIWFAGGRLELL